MCRFSWPLSLFGQGLFVFAVVALSGPGRIDIEDGQTRFEVGRSLVEHGDSALRDSRIWCFALPGRDNLAFTTYRFPQSVLAAGAIVVADGTGDVREGRRHFFFVMTSAFAAALLSIFFSIGFRALGCQPRSAILWGLGGIFCTPNWFYGTSTFDDILCSLTVVAAAVTAFVTCARREIVGAVAAGLWMGLAFNCKQPTGAFVLVVLVLHDNRLAPTRQRILRAAIIVAGLLLGVAVEKAYDYLKFPFDKSVVHKELIEEYSPVYASSPVPAIACFSVSPACGIFWYCPTVILSLLGIRQLWRQGQRTLAAAVILSSAAFIGFHCFIWFFKGDLAWGPRYLTPWFAVIWLFAPLGASTISRKMVATLLTLGIVVQLLALSVDPRRLYVEREVSPAFGSIQPSLYFQPRFSHLLQRPRKSWKSFRMRARRKFILQLRHRLSRFR